MSGRGFLTGLALVLVLALAGSAEASVRMRLSWSDPQGQSDGQPPFDYVATP